MDPLSTLVLVAGIAAVALFGYRVTRARPIRRVSWKIICWGCKRDRPITESDCAKCLLARMMPLSKYQADGGGTGFWIDPDGPFVSSLCEGEWKPNDDDSNLPRGKFHAPVFDFDFPVSLTQSDHGGRLVVSKRMFLSKYLGLLEVMEGLRLIAPLSAFAFSALYGKSACVGGIPGFRAPGSDMLPEAVIHLTVPAKLVPSSTEGHFHLYLETGMDWPDYLRLMRFMAEAGLLEKEWVDMNERRQMAMLRKPEYKKAPT